MNETITKPETETVELEIVSPEDKLVKYANQTGLEKTSALSLAEVFKPASQATERVIKRGDLGL